MEAVRILHDNGIKVRGNYVVPPNYSRDDFDALSEWAAANLVTYAGYTVLTPMPGTRLYAQMADQIVDTHYDSYNFFNCVLRTRLDCDEFYRRIAALWLIKKGSEVL
jgi:radical SAM superfamily enzyme YgiQ (UPF0313 family)